VVHQNREEEKNSSEFFEVRKVRKNLEEEKIFGENLRIPRLGFATLTKSKNASRSSKNYVLLISQV